VPSQVKALDLLKLGGSKELWGCDIFIQMAGLTASNKQVVSQDNRIQNTI
jgi:hypothetical protein